MQYVVKDGQSIYDVAVLLYGDAQYSVKLCTDNGITITDSIVGLSLTYDDTIIGQILTNNRAVTYVQVPTDNSYQIRENQSNYDVCIQLGYGLDRYGEFIALSGLPCNIINNVGSQISVTKIQTNVGSTIFATLSDDVIPTPPITSGIGWMTIGTTFIIG